tara:strand:- start:92 stop:514 length:423 start_codon:yes stop_codon:yes gene_type:complete
MRAINIGQAGEYYTLFDLSLQNYNCFLVNESLCFDIGMTDNGDLYRIQVKTTSKKRNKHSYQFTIARSVREYLGDRKLKHHDKNYNVTDFEILALVILPKKIVFYVPFHAIHGQKYINLRGNEHFSLKDCLASIKEAEGN